MINPKNFTSVAYNSHFSAFNKADSPGVSGEHCEHAERSPVQTSDQDIVKVDKHKNVKKILCLLGTLAINANEESGGGEG